MYDHVFVHLWMMAGREERLLLAEVFNIPKNGIAEIKDQSVISDGHNEEDLRLITKSKMVEFVGEPEDTALSFNRLWELTVAKARSIVHPPVGVVSLKNTDEEHVPADEQKTEPEVVSSPTGAIVTPDEDGIVRSTTETGILNKDGSITPIEKIKNAKSKKS